MWYLIRWFRYRRWWSMLLIVCLPQALLAEAPIIEFELSEQPLAQSVAEVARQAEQAVLFRPTDLRGLTAPPLSGALATEDALRHLLKNTELEAINTSSGWLVRSRPTSTTPPEFQAQELEQQPDEMLVVGRYAQSLDRARHIARSAERHEDVTLAERIGEFPALNVAEAIKRSPGVSVVRDRGEALFLSIRGLPTQFNTLTMNGDPVATHENARTSEQYGRRFHYDTLPAELIAGLAVRKSAKASDPAGAIGGSINLTTYQPLALEAPTLHLGAAVSHSDLAREEDPRLSLLSSWRNANESLGLLLGTTYSERHLRQDRALNFRWRSLDTDPAITTPSSVRPTLEQEHRQRFGLNAAMQWHPNDQTELSLNWLSLNQVMDYREYSYSADYDPAQLLPHSDEQRGNALIAGRTLKGSSQIGMESTELTDRFDVVQFALNHETNEWLTEFSFTRSATHSNNSEPIRRTRLRREDEVDIAFRYHENDIERLPDIRFLNGGPDNADLYPGRRLEWRTIDAEDTLTGTRARALRHLSNNIADSIEFGVQWRSHHRDYQRRDALIVDGIEDVYFPTGYFRPLPVEDFLAGYSGNLPRTWQIPEESAFWADVDSYYYGQAPTEDDKLNSYRIKEEVGALYAQLHWDRSPWRGNLGLRYEHTEQTTRGHQKVPYGDLVPAASQSDYGHSLPAINLVYETAENRLWRFSVARTLNRPDLQDLAPSLTPNSGDLATAVGGNPNLKPVKAWQTDLAWEWYFKPGSLLSVGAFYTRLNDFIQSESQTSILNGELFEVDTKSNGADAQVRGLELDYQQAFAMGPGQLSLQANITLTESVADYRIHNTVVRDDLADVSSKTINVGLSYETDSFSARAHYNWRDRVLKEVGASTLAAQNNDAFGSLDAQLAFPFAHNLTLTLEGINLTGAAEWESVGDDEFAGFTYYGRTFLGGIKVHW